MSFSERHGYSSPKTILQIDSIDNDLKNRLWNWIDVFYIDKEYSWITESPKKKYYVSMWFNFFKQPIDTLQDRTESANKYIREWYFDSPWNRVYDLVEFLANLNSDNANREQNFFRIINGILEEEKSGFRFVGNKLAKLTNKEELNEVNQAIEKSLSLNLDGVHEHILNAVSKYADRKQPDYRNSIKESISAVESMSKIIEGNNKATLGGALSKIGNKIGIHKALIQGFKSIYGYTSDEGGIRHSLLEAATVEAEDAKYMLVSCSAFINYLIEKSSKAGIDL